MLRVITHTDVKPNWRWTLCSIWHLRKKQPQTALPAVCRRPHAVPVRRKCWLNKCFLNQTSCFHAFHPTQCLTRGDSQKQLKSYCGKLLLPLFLSQLLDWPTTGGSEVLSRCFSFPLSWVFPWNMPTVCFFFFIIWTHRQEVGWSDLQSFISLLAISPSSLPCFHCLFLLLALGTHRQLPSTPLYPAHRNSCIRTHKHWHNHTHTHTHTHTHISPSPHTVPSCCYCNRAHSSPFYLGCNCHSCRERERERERRMCVRGCVHECVVALSPITITSWSNGVRVASLSVFFFFGRMARLSRTV